VAVANINWNVNEPFVLLSHIFENVIVGWKETLVYAFNDRSLRIAGLKGLIMKSETNNWKMMSLMEAVLNGNREGLSMISQNLGLSFSIFNGLESSMASVFQRINQIREVMVNNQLISVKQGVISMNLLLKIQKEMKTGLNEFNKKISVVIKRNLDSVQGVILTQLGERIQIVGVSINNLRIENERMLAMDFGQIYDKLKSEMQTNNENLIVAIR
jgi:hypothetical protein